MSRLKEILNREPVFINPYTDFGFKRLFGEEGSKDLLKDFLNQILPKRHRIAELVFQNIEQIPKLEFERKAFFDIKCKSITGEHFIIEMQKAKLEYFQDRSLFYMTFPIQEQGQKGEWDFKLQLIYFVAILDFEYDLTMKKRLLLRKIALKDQNGELFSDKMHLLFIQMPLFAKQQNEIKTRFDKWLYFLQNLENFEEIPSILNEPIFKKGFEIAKIAKMSKQDYIQYETSRLALLENKAAHDTALKEGIEIGKIEGIAEGISQNKIDVVVNCIKSGFSIEMTAKALGETIDFVTDIIKSQNLKLNES